MEDANIHTALRAYPDRCSERVAYRVGPEDVVLEKDLPLGLLDQRQHRRKRVGAVSQESHTIRSRQGGAGHARESSLERGIERSDWIEAPRRLNQVEWGLRPPLACVIVAGATHPAALLEKRPNVDGAIRAHVNRGRLHVNVRLSFRQKRSQERAACVSGGAR